MMSVLSTELSQSPQMLPKTCYRSVVSCKNLWICTDYSHGVVLGHDLGVTELHSHFSQESEQAKGIIRADPGGEPGDSETTAVATPSPLDQKHVLER